MNPFRITRGAITRGAITRGGVMGVTLIAATAACLASAPRSVYGQPRQQRAASGAGKKAAAAPSRQARVPAALVGTWVWGAANPGKYVNRATGEYVGHAGGGAVSYTFTPEGTYRRYVLIHFGAGFSNQSTFSSMEGTAAFDEAAGTFTLRLSRGQITFEKKAGMQKRPLSREDMERAGTVFSYRLDKDEEGRTVLMVNDKGKPASEGRRFYKEGDNVK